MRLIVPTLLALSLALGCSKKEEKKPAPAPAKAASKAADKEPPPTVPKDAVTTKEVTYKIGGQEFRGYIATKASAGEKRPGVLVVHEWWGHNDYARHRARMLAKMGYTAFAVDMYGDGKQAAHPKDAMAFAGAATKDKAVTEARFVAAMDVLKKHESVEADKIAAIGYCFGGAVVLEMAKRGVDLDLVASFHGSLGVETEFAKGDVKAAVFVAHGADDGFVKPEVLAKFQEQMKKASVDFTFEAYEGAKHSFTNPSADGYGKKFDLPLAYNKEADEKSWATLTAMLSDAFK